MAKRRKCSSLDKKVTSSEKDRRIKKRVSSKTGSDWDSMVVENVEKIVADVASRFLGEPVLEGKARWPERYQTNEPVFNNSVQAKCHYSKAEVDGLIYCLGDGALVQADKGKDSYIYEIIEIFQAVDGSKNFTGQKFYRAKDTVIQTCADLIDKKCIFFSDIKTVKPLDCLLKKLSILHLPLKSELDVEKMKSACDFYFYFDKKYLLRYSSFVSFPPPETTANSGETDFSVVCGDASTTGSSDPEEHTLPDMYSGCGAMSTGLCLGANSCGVKLVTKWAVDFNRHVCKSLAWNHPETEVRNETADDFLALFKEWKNLCVEHGLLENNGSSSENQKMNDEMDDEDDEDGGEDDANSEVFEVDDILSVRFGYPKKNKTGELEFKVRWKGFSSVDDTWEPRENLSLCQEKLKEYVSSGYKAKILPLPGSIDVICGGPPCQGISGLNRFRNEEAPLDDSKNKQLIVFMNLVDFLKPKIVLMENVVDIVKFCGGFLGRYAVGRLVGMGYQASIGLMAAGSYGLPQFRRRMFMCGALSIERLPKYPLPTHVAVARGCVPKDFESNTIVHEKSHNAKLKPSLHIGDAISDLPPVDNNEKRDDMPHNSEPQTKFQLLIRLPRDEMNSSLTVNSTSLQQNLYDHRPLCLNEDGCERVCKIPKKKGANFRNLKGVIVGKHNKVEFDPKIPRQRVTSGEFLVPNCRCACSSCAGQIVGFCFDWNGVMRARSERFDDPTGKSDGVLLSRFGEEKLANF